MANINVVGINLENGRLVRLTSSDNATNSSGAGVSLQGVTGLLGSTGILGTTGISGGTAGTLQTVMVYRTSALSLPNNAVTTIPWDTESYDPAGMHSTVTNPERLTVAISARYIFTCGVYVTGSSGGTYRELIVEQFNSSNTSLRRFIQDLPPVGTGAQVIQLSGIMNMSAGDYIVAKFYQNSGGTLSLNVTSGSIEDNHCELALLADQ